MARYLFRRVVSWGRSSNVFLENGARLYLDVGSHPEYATPECDSIADLVAHDKAGERILEHLVAGGRGAPAGRGDPRRHLPVQEQHRLGRQLLRLPRELPDEPARRLRPLRRGAHPVPRHPPDLRRRRQGAADRPGRGVLPQPASRAHLGGRVVGDHTRSRPIINTRDEPHADAERFRRLHVIVGDSNMSEYATFLKVGTTSILLRMLEDPGTVLRDMTLENPIRAIREISHDMTCRRKVRLANGREASALDIQSEYLDPGPALPARRHGLSPAGGPGPRHVGALPEGDRERPMDPRPRVRLGDQVRNLIEAYREREGMPLDPPQGGADRPAVPRRQPRAGASTTACETRGLVERMATDDEIERALDEPPQTTRARLRGEFIRRAKERRRDFTVDWVHLKLNDQAQRTVLCKDPFRARRRAGGEADRQPVTGPRASKGRRSTTLDRSWPPTRRNRRSRVRSTRCGSARRRPPCRRPSSGTPTAPT